MCEGLFGQQSPSNVKILVTWQVFGVDVWDHGTTSNDLMDIDIMGETSDEQVGDRHPSPHWTPVRLSP